MTVDGGWGIWGSWTECPVTCGGGVTTRTRKCDSPAPKHEGKDCTVDSTSESDSEALECNITPCFSK